MPAQATSRLDPARPMRADARRNRAAILEAARELFSSERPDVQIDDVARRAGVGVGTVYRHFPDKEALMGELVRARFQIFNERLRQAIAEGEDGVDAFEVLADALRDHAASVAADAATRFAFQSGGERVFAHADAEKHEFVQLCGVLVERAHASGELRRDFGADDVPMVMCGLTATMGKPQAAGWDWRRHLELIISGMRAGPAPASRPAA